MAYQGTGVGSGRETLVVLYQVVASSEVTCRTQTMNRFFKSFKSVVC
jgi:hypothetical protein